MAQNDMRPTKEDLESVQADPLNAITQDNHNTSFKLILKIFALLALIGLLIFGIFNLDISNFTSSFTSKEPVESSVAEKSESYSTSKSIAVDSYFIKIVTTIGWLGCFACGLGLINSLVSGEGMIHSLMGLIFSFVLATNSSGILNLLLQIFSFH